MIMMYLSSAVDNLSGPSVIIYINPHPPRAEEETLLFLCCRELAYYALLQCRLLWLITWVHLFNSPLRHISLLAIALFNLINQSDQESRGDHRRYICLGCMGCPAPGRGVNGRKLCWPEIETRERMMMMATGAVLNHINLMPHLQVVCRGLLRHQPPLDKDQ